MRIDGAFVLNRGPRGGDPFCLTGGIYFGDNVGDKLCFFACGDFDFALRGDSSVLGPDVAAAVSSSPDFSRATWALMSEGLIL